jgi:hypothetical protein
MDFSSSGRKLLVFSTENKGKSIHKPNTNAEFGKYIPIANNQQAIWINTLTSKVWTNPLALMLDKEEFDEIQSNVSILANQLCETWQQEDVAARKACGVETQQ